MGIFVGRETRVVYQGGTGRQGSFHMLRNREYGTNVVAAINPKKGGENVDGVPVLPSVSEAVERFGANASCIFVPAPGVLDAVREAYRAGIAVITVITEGVPMHDEARAYHEVRRYAPGTRVIGPNCPGIITPGECNIGITPGEIARGGGPVGIVSRSGTLTYQALYDLKQHEVGVTTCIGIGGDPVPGTNFVDCLQAFEEDEETKLVMMIGEIGGSDEEDAAEFIRTSMTKPVVAYVAGRTAPIGKKMGHAGAIVSGNTGSAGSKLWALEAAGAHVTANPTECAERVVQLVQRL